MSYVMIENYSCVWPSGPTALDPKGFAIHWWGAGSPQFYPIVELLVNRAIQGSASIHFVAEEGRVACLTSPFEVAWGQGDGANGWGNRNLISIECNPRCSPGDRETVAELIADQHIRNGIPINLYSHNKFTATQCCGVWQQWIPWLTERANQIVAEKKNGTPPQKVEEEFMTEEQLKKYIHETNKFNQQLVNEGNRTIVNEIRAHTAHNASKVIDVVKTIPDVSDEVVNEIKAQLEAGFEFTLKSKSE